MTSGTRHAARTSSRDVRLSRPLMPGLERATGAGVSGTAAVCASAASDRSPVPMLLVAAT